MMYQSHKIADGESAALYRVIFDPVQYLLEYRLIALDAPKPADNNSDFFLCDEFRAEMGLRYCILIISIDRYGYSETKFLHDVTRNRDIALELLQLLCDSAVTPCTAKYIIEDLI